MEPVRLPPRSPNLTAYAERFVLSIKSECLDRLVLVGEGHLRRVVTEYVEHYHLKRSHQGLGQSADRGSPTACFRNGHPTREARRATEPLRSPGSLSLGWGLEQDDLRTAAAEYVEHYHRERSHQGLGNQLIQREPRSGSGPITCHPRLGGFLNHYARRAA